MRVQCLGKMISTGKDTTGHGVQFPARAATSWHRGGTAGAVHPLRRGVADLCRAHRVMDPLL